MPSFSKLTMDHVITVKDVLIVGLGAVAFFGVIGLFCSLLMDFSK